MATITFDTHKFIQTLQAAGFEQKQAEAVAHAFKEGAGEAELATKADLREIRTDIELLRRDLTGTITTMEARVMGEIKLNRWMLGAIIIAEVAPLLAKLFH
ncbi:MAG: DUF1640 domain-containing protein [Methylococcaceae bacterium]|nr:MAG: DUF1640 domain-containing protein [Methylococcaceae bacterium]